MKRIYDFLKNKNINVYFPGQHNGKCEENYVVIRKSNLIPATNNKLGNRVVDIMLYSPVDSYIQAEEFVKNVKEELKELDFLRKTGLETAILVEDDIEAYSNVVEYIIQKELE